MKESKRFARKKESFVCGNCGREVEGTGYTDHCPDCLFSMHVDVNPGDRKADCRGMMEPRNAVTERDSIIIYYRCLKCGMEKRVVAANDDNPDLLQRLAAMNMQG